MRVSTNLLKQFGDIPASDEEIVKLIQEHIGEVDYHHNMANDYKDIVIAQISSKKDHPDADKLGVYEIEYGQNEPIQVVAGDKSLNVKDKVVYLKVGSIVPYSILTEEKPFKIKSVTLRGVNSNGMLGSERELNIGNNHQNVLVLPPDAPVGENFSNYYDLNDTVIEIENKALTNRGDLFGILGISRELTAILGNKFESPTWYTNENIDMKPEDSCLNIKIVNDAEAICPRYAAIALDDIKVEPSPVWLKSILVRCNIKPVNNIVDITNYISILIGQPLHAFDFDKLVKNDPNSNTIAEINIRMANSEEKILALDDKLYDLDEKTMVIADSTHPIAIAGVIGGKDTEVDENTTRIVLESANFNKSSIRRTSMRLGIFTEAATRFKHDLDPKQCIAGIRKAVEMMREISKAKIASKVVDIYHQEVQSKTIEIEPLHLNSVLGTDISTHEIHLLLENLEYGVKEKTVKDKEHGKVKHLYITPASWRKDIEIKEDIYEDIGRIYGFNNIEIILPKKEILPPLQNKIIQTKSKIREILSNSGSNELITYSFVDIDSFKNCSLDSNLAYKIKNPLSPELSLMRTNILQSLLSKAKENIQRGNEIFVIYEMNIAHLNNYTHKDKLPIEHWYLSLVLADCQINSKENPYFSTKKYLEKIFTTLGIHNVQYDLIAESEEIELPVYIKNILGIFDPNTSAIVSIGGVKLAVVGEFSEKVKDQYKLPQYSAGMEINIDELTKLKTGSKKYKEQPIYPPFTQDLCFEMDVEKRCIEIEDSIKHILKKENLWSRVVCLDIYQDSKKIEKKRITYRIVASNYDKTLEDKEIKDIVSRIKEAVSEKYEAILV